MRSRPLVLVACVAGFLGCRHAAPPAPAQQTPAPAAASALVEHVVAPNEADRAADRWLQPQYATVGGPTPPRGRLVVYLVGANGKPAGGRRMYTELAAMGFHVVSPMYANDYGITKICDPKTEPDDDCHGKARLEAFEGKDHSRHLEVSRANSAEERVVRMLAHLHRGSPNEGWGAFLDGARPRWEEIVIAGHSHGASTSGLIGKVRKVHRV